MPESLDRLVYGIVDVGIGALPHLTSERVSRHGPGARSSQCGEHLCFATRQLDGAARTTRDEGLEIKFEISAANDPAPKYGPRDSSHLGLV